MKQHEREILKAQSRRHKVTNYLRKDTKVINIKKSLNIRYMEETLGFRKGRIQKFVTEVGRLTDSEILIVYDHLKKLTRF